MSEERSRLCMDHLKHIMEAMAVARSSRKRATVYLSHISQMHEGCRNRKGNGEPLLAWLPGSQQRNLITDSGNM